MWEHTGLDNYACYYRCIYISSLESKQNGVILDTFLVFVLITRNGAMSKHQLEKLGRSQTHNSLVGGQYLRASKMFK